MSTSTTGLHCPLGALPGLQGGAEAAVRPVDGAAVRAALRTAPQAGRAEGAAAGDCQVAAGGGGGRVIVEEE